MKLLRKESFILKVRKVSSPQKDTCDYRHSCKPPLSKVGTKIISIFLSPKCLLLLLVFLSQVRGCSDSDLDLPISKKIGSSFTTSNIILGVLSYSSQDSIYFISEFTNNATNDKYIGILKTDSDFNSTIMKSIKENPTDLDYSMSDDGNYIYFFVGLNGFFIEINSSDLSINKYFDVDSVNFSNLAFPKTLGDAGFTSSSNIIFFNARYGAGAIWSVCKWSRLAAQAQCFDYGSNQKLIFTPIDANNVFISLQMFGNTNLYFVKADYSNPSSLSWQKYVQCSPSCSSGINRAILSQDQTSIYSVHFFGDNILFYSINATNGDPLSSGLIMSTTNGELRDIEEIGQYISIVYVDYTVSKIFIAFIDKLSSSITKELELTGASVVASKYKVINGVEYIFMGGTIGNVYRLLKTKYSNIEKYTFTKLVSTKFSSKTSFLLEDPPSALPALNLTNKNVAENLTASLQFSSETITEYDIEYYGVIDKEDFNKAYLPDIKIEEYLNLTCKYSYDSFQTTYDLVELEGEQIPSWMTFNETEESILLNRTPNAEKETLFKFGIDIVHASQSSSKKVYLTIMPCTISNCQSCQNDDPQVCTSCSFGYSWSSDHNKCEKADATTSRTVAQVVAGASMGLALTSALLTTSSPVGIFSTANQFQLYLLLPMLPPYFPSKVGQFILGLDFSFVSLDFIPTDKIPLFKELKRLFSYSQENAYLGEVGMSSGSCIINYLPMFFITLILGIFHATVGMIFCKVRDKPESSKCRKAATKLFTFMTFNMYIRFILEGFLFLMLSIGAEFKAFNTNLTIPLLSLIMAGFFSFGVIVFLALLSCWFLAERSQKTSELHNHWSISEFQSGLKKSRSAKFNSCMFVLIRLLSVMTLLSLSKQDEPMNRDVKGNSLVLFYIEGILFLITHCISCGYTLWVRPYEITQNNIIEAVNQICYICAIIPLMVLKRESDWSSAKEDVYIFLLLFPNLFSFCVNLAYLFANIFKKRAQVEPRVRTNMQYSNNSNCQGRNMSKIGLNRSNQ
ncbi:unnamed protein product [Moneuplotes crassus]|uniref:Uncharacterized protein n=1 Tax=Euplotes crassus TaxID=5936 RepID=A0AAD1XLX8_EUPCR|nr:unnamed protein product [Moneuplotes crassus]